MQTIASIKQNLRDAGIHFTTTYIFSGFHGTRIDLKGGVAIARKAQKATGIEFPKNYLVKKFSATLYLT